MTRRHRRPDGLLVLTLRKPYANGTADFIFSEVELAQKLAALVPPNRKNAVSYHGVLAPRHRHRNRVIPETPETKGRPLRSVLTNFVGPALEGPIEAELRVLRSGRSVTHTQAIVMQEGSVRTVVIACFGGSRLLHHRR